MDDVFFRLTKSYPGTCLCHGFRLSEMLGLLNSILLLLLLSDGVFLYTLS
ncbi:rCG26588 [Rattus norvegicus]|uniref:RCG26588 n=1 Tax=Rattus norvegicus TaxID=10116 RepID=A6HMA2_RAT|nr:rCG26588 [Rattus norvegicus]